MGADDLKIDVVVVGASVRVQVSGELDICSAADLVDALERLDAGRRVVEVDTSDVGFCDCAGYSALRRGIDRVQDDGGVVRFGPTSRAVSTIAAVHAATA